jgi:glycosyltransferase involved in cell wall biosynthesis
MPKVSIITPTANRQRFLPAIAQCVLSQTFHDFEWLIHDHGPEAAGEKFTDPRIRYMHDMRAAKIGAKRNLLCHAAQGEIIVHFDDDDFYAPNYIENMLTLMRDRNADFVKLFGFFLYAPEQRVLAYWDLESDFPLHFHLSPNVPIFPFLNGGNVSGAWGYGFSYVYHRAVWQSFQFPDRDHGEDQVFADAARERFRLDGTQDHARSCLHIVHGTNTSIKFPQQILPADMLPVLFPQCESWLRLFPRPAS